MMDALTGARHHVAALNTHQRGQATAQHLEMCMLEIEQLRTDTATERERCAVVCEQLAQVAWSEMIAQPQNSPARDRYFARYEALRSAAVEIRLG